MTPDTTCANPACDNQPRTNSKYCEDACRETVARLRYEEKRAKKGGSSRSLYRNDMTLEEFDDKAREHIDKSTPLPPVPAKVLTVRAEEMDFNTPQHAVACFSDYHLGGVVDPRVTGGIGGYNMALARTRLADWRDGVLRFAQMIQLSTEVKTLHVFALGDDLEGNGHMFGTQALQMETSVYFQYLDFVRDIPEVLVSFLQRFDEVHVYKVFGNHGRSQGRWRDNYDPDNFELMAWQHIKDRCELAAPGKFTFDISEAFFQIVDILGYSFYLRHGDGTNLRSTYTGPLDTKLAMNSIVGEVINYMVIAHHHTATEDEAEIAGDIMSNGCFVGPSLLALKMKRPRANRPSQEMFFVHPKYGITHRNRIHLATVEEIQQVRKVNRWQEQVS